MNPTRAGDVDRLYGLLDQIEQRLGGTRTLNAVNGRSGWPSHGLYFFFEAGETRPNGRPRVVRVGTHALTANSQTTLWKRLAQHRGNQGGTNPGGGNHRGSIFRLHIGAALLRRENAPSALLKSWLGKNPNPGWSSAEQDHERVVSRYIGVMPFLWLGVPTRADKTSDRSYLERNTIALLSAVAASTEPSSRSWLGHKAVNPAIGRSGLWNVNHVDNPYDPGFLNRMEANVGKL